MNASLVPQVLAASLLALAASAAAQEPEVPAAVNVEGMPQQLRARIEAEAKKGPTAVINYLNRTRHLHNLRPEDVLKPTPAKAKAPAKP